MSALPPELTKHTWEDPDLSFDFAKMAANRTVCYLTIPVMREIERRRNHPFYKYEPDFHPERNQLGFHKSKAYGRLLFGGNQSGKSRAVAQECAWILTGRHPYQEYKPGMRVYVVSASYRTLQEGVWRHLKVTLPEWEIEEIGASVPGGWSVPNWIRMKNGSQIDFLSGEGREDARKKAQGAELDFMVIDEEIDEELYKELIIRLLARGGRMMVGATLVRSENWCLDLEDRALKGDPKIALFRLDSRVAVKRGHIKAGQVDEVVETFSAEDVEVRIHGKSRRHQGLVYQEFNENHVVDDFQIPREWTRFCAIDPGFRTAAVLWAAVAPDGKTYLYREHYAHHRHWTELIDKIFSFEGYRLVERGEPISEAYPQMGERKRRAWVFDEEKTEEIEIHWLDPAGFGHHETGERKIGHLLAMEGVNVAPARNEVDLGIEMCRRSLMIGMDGLPRLKVFRTLTNFLTEIRTYRWARDTSSSQQNERPDKPVKKKDHLLDCWRYLELGGLDPIPFNAEEKLREKQIRELHRLEWQTTGLEERLRLDRIRGIEEDLRGPQDRVEHPGGIGADY